MGLAGLVVDKGDFGEVGRYRQEGSRVGIEGLQFCAGKEDGSIRGTMQGLALSR